MLTNQWQRPNKTAEGTNQMKEHAFLEMKKYIIMYCP